MRNDSSRGLKVDAFFNGKESIRAHITSFARSVAAETFPPVTKITMIVRAINGADSLTYSQIFPEIVWHLDGNRSKFQRMHNTNVQ